MPYRIDIADGDAALLDRLIELGALDAERDAAGAIAAVMPDAIGPDALARALGRDGLAVSPAVGRDAESVWVLTPQPVRVGSRTLLLSDTTAFGTGEHPTTALCLEALEQIVAHESPSAVLDVGVGSGVLALAALLLGVPHATGVDIDDAALRAAAGNARRNGLETRLTLASGGPEAVTGTWPLVIANVLAAPLIEMAPALVRRVGRRGTLLLSGIPASVAHDVDGAYRRLGLRGAGTAARSGWVALTLRATW